jgi:hypothetical protein
LSAFLGCAALKGFIGLLLADALGFDLRGIADPWTEADRPITNEPWSSNAAKKKNKKERKKNLF